MNIDEFKALDIDHKIEYFNKELNEGNTVTRIREDLRLSEKGWQKEVKKHGFKYNTKSKNYERVTNVVTYKKNNDKDNTLVVIDDVASKDINYELMFRELENVKQMSNKLEEMYAWYELQRNVVDIEVERLAIEPNDNEIVTRSFKVYEDVYKEFGTFCKGHKEYKVQDLVSKALKEFCNKYSEWISEGGSKRVLKRKGGKWKHSNRLLELIPDHKLYVEPYFGSGAIFFKKKGCNLSVLNDIDGDVVNLFKVIRDKPLDLAYAIDMTPYSREEYNDCYKEDGNINSIEKARRFLVRSNMAFGVTSSYKPGWRISGVKDSVRREARTNKEWNRLPNSIVNISAMLKNAEIECRDAIEVIEKYNNDNVFMYIDPPYVLSTRYRDYYKHELSDEDHIKLLEVINKSKAKIMLSGYDNEIYSRYLNEWTKLSFKVAGEKGIIKVETLWMNYDINEPK